MLGPIEVIINPQIMVWGTASQVIPLLKRIDKGQPVYWAYSQEQSVPADHNIEVHWGENLVQIDGSYGDFSIHLGASTVVKAGAVALFPEEILLPPPQLEVGQSVALLLNGTSRGIFARALNLAAGLTTGNTVYIITDDVQVAYPGGEDLFAQARSQGVIFFRVADFKVIDGEKGFVIDLPALMMEIAVDKVIDYRSSFTKSNWGAEFKLGPLSVSGLLNTRREGIYVFPPSQELAPSEETLLYQALASRLATIALGKAVFSLAAYIDNTRCALCLTCYRNCPHQAISLVPGKTSHQLYDMAAYINPAACKSCGGCYAVCPALAISWSDETNDLGAILVCENSGWDRGMYPAAKVRQYPCANAMSNSDILEALANHERITIYVCREGSCRHLGNAPPIEVRIKRLTQLMQQLGIANQIEIVRKSAAEIDYQWGEGQLIDCR